MFIFKLIGVLHLRSDPRTSSNTSEGTDEGEEILGSDDDEQEDPKDYIKGKIRDVKGLR